MSEPIAWLWFKDGEGTPCAASRVYSERHRCEPLYPESRILALEGALREYFDALDGSSDPTAVGSTCRLIRAESTCRALLHDKEKT